MEAGNEIDSESFVDPNFKKESPYRFNETTIVLPEDFVIDNSTGMYKIIEFLKVNISLIL